MGLRNLNVRRVRDYSEEKLRLNLNLIIIQYVLYPGDGKPNRRDSVGSESHTSAKNIYEALPSTTPTMTDGSTLVTKDFRDKFSGTIAISTKEPSLTTTVDYVPVSVYSLYGQLFLLSK